MKTLKNLCFKFLAIGLFIFTSLVSQGQVLDLESTTEGVLLPRMTTVQRTAITSPSQSETVYDIDTKSFWFWEDMQWNQLGDQLVPFLDCGVGISGDTLNNTLPFAQDTISLTSTEMITAETNVTVCLDVDHTFVGDLEVFLIAPDSGANIELTTRNGDGGDNFKRTCFTSNAKRSITTISVTEAPFTDAYLPEVGFSDLVGLQINGDWTLQITDVAGGDNGTLNSWSINITNSFASVAQSALFSDFAHNASNADIAKALSDTDSDTKIQVEETNDDDIIRFDVDGQQRLEMKKAPNNSLIFDLSLSDVLMGENVGELMNNGSHNLIIGSNAGKDMTGGFRNVIMGADSGKLKTEGDDNVIIGADSGEALSTGNDNVFVGGNSGQLNTGSQNTFLGRYSGDKNTGTGSVFLGYAAGSNDLTANNRLYIDNSNTTTPLIYGEFANNKLLFFGNVGIGGVTDNKDLASGYKLSVKGKVICEEVRVELEANWPDYVFENDYELKTLEEVEKFINKNGHLPNVPSAETVEDEGIQLGEMNKILMEKVEELTLYIIAQEKRIEALETSGKN